MASPSQYEVEAAQYVMEYFFGPSAGKWKVTYRVIEELGLMLSKQKVCNSVFDALPRPGFVDKADRLLV